MTASGESVARSGFGRRFRRSRTGERLTAVGLALLLLIVWEVTAHAADLLVLPPISEIVPALIVFIQDGTLLDALGVSMLTLVIGMAIAVLLGIAIGALMGLFRRVEYALDVYVNAGMSAPLIAFVPLFVLLFGIGYPTRVLVVVLYAIFPIIVNVFAGMRNVDRSLVEMGESFGASGRQQFWNIQLPHAFPLVLAGIHIGASRGIKGLITGEVLIAVVGLGALVDRYGSAFTMDRLYAIIFVLVALSMVLVWSIEAISRRLIRHAPAR